MKPNQLDCSTFCLCLASLFVVLDISLEAFDTKNEKLFDCAIPSFPLIMWLEN